MALGPDPHVYSRIGAGVTPVLSISDLRRQDQQDRAIEQQLRTGELQQEDARRQIVRDTFLQLAGMDDAQRSQAYPRVIQGLLQRGVIRKGELPDTYEAAKPDFDTWSRYGRQPQAMMNLGPQGVFDPNKGSIVPGTAAPPKPPEKPARGSFEDYLTSIESAKGSPLTPAEILSERQNWERANDTPPKTSYQNVTVMLKGKPTLVGYDSSTNTYHFRGQDVSADVEAMPRAPQGGSGSGSLTPTARANVINSRRTQWERFSKTLRERQGAIQKVTSGLEALDRGNRNAATQAIVIGFNRLLDETSVVREGEYARSEQLVPLVNQIEGAIQKITLGGAAMTDADLKALATEAQNIARALEGISQEAAVNMRQGIEEELSDYGIPSTRVFGNSALGKSRPTSPQAPPNSAAPGSAQVGSTVTYQGKRYRVTAIVNGQAELEPVQ